MNEAHIEAARHLINFARNRAEEVYGDSEYEYPGSQDDLAAILESADTLEAYLDN